PAACNGTHTSRPDTSHRAGHAVTSPTNRTVCVPPSRPADTRIGVFRPIRPYSGLDGLRGENLPSRLFSVRESVAGSALPPSLATPREIRNASRSWTYWVMSFHVPL